MVTGDVPLVVCVTADAGIRERVASRLNDCGVVLMCADVAELRAVFCPSAQAEWAHDGPVVRAAPAGVLAVGDLLIDGGSHVASWRGTPLRLTRLEWQLLGSLATPPSAVWTYESLFGAVWGGAYLGDTSILHSAIKRLRRKLGDGMAVETVRGVGYRLALT